MSNSSNTPNNSSIPSKADATSCHSMTANSSERMVKQSTGETSGAVKIEASSNERQLPPVGSAADNRLGFASAATLVNRLVEITDEELLDYALEFERKHGL